MSPHNDLALLMAKAEAVQSIVLPVEKLSDALQYAVDVTCRQGGSTLAAPGWDESTTRELEELCRQRQLTLLSSDLRSQAQAIHTGLTRVDWGIAETATLVLDSSREDLRLATMLSETHVAVLPRSRIRTDATALEPELQQLMAASPGYLAFISGASRTADIERVLTIGVHGPCQMHILVLEEE